jgi:hypothetical protein
MRADRRHALTLGVAAAIGSEIATRTPVIRAQTPPVRMAQTAVLDIACEDTGNSQGFPGPSRQAHVRSNLYPTTFSL